MKTMKTTSVLRRVSMDDFEFRPVPAAEGDVCLFELDGDSSITLEAATGRLMEIGPGDRFLGAPGYRTPTRPLASGTIPLEGLVPGANYWSLSKSGIVGELTDPPVGSAPYLGRVSYVGAAHAHEKKLNIRDFVVAAGVVARDRDAPIYVIVGSCGNVGKTTAGVAVLRALRMRGHGDVVAWKAVGTGSIGEIARYLDFGAAAFDCVDFGLPATYPLGRSDIVEYFDCALDFCLSQPADAVIIEPGGDLSGDNPTLLARIKSRRRDIKIVLAASDAFAAVGVQRALAEIGLAANVITGPCTDSLRLREQTERFCGVPAIPLLLR